MTGGQNPIVLLRKIVCTVKGIEKAEAWKMYGSIAFLCIAAAMLLALQASMLAGTAGKVVSGQQHILLQAGKVSAPSVVTTAPVIQREETKTTPKETVREKPESGEWYYSEIHKDWRFRKK